MAEAIVRMIPLMITLVLIAIPLGHICKRLGYSRWLGLIALVPFGYLILIWWLALKAKPIPQSG
jgi:hypothetical protein